LLREDDIILEVAASPVDGYVAFVTADNIETLSNLRLKYLTLPDGAVRPVTPLLPPGTAITESHTGDPLYEATRSIRRASLSWSPDGRQLAFIGAQGGTSADLYVYSLDAGKITRLSDEPGQAYNPSWSPSGESIFFPSVRHFGTGAGYTMEAAWIARADGGGVGLLYEPMSMGEEVVDWIDDETVWLYSWSDVFANIDLRALNISTGHTETLWAGSFTVLAHDPRSSTVLLGLNGLTPYRDPSGQRQKGIYLVVPGGKDPQQLAEIDVSKIVWSPEASQFFVASREGMLAVWSSGRIEWVDAVVPGFPVAAPGGRTWAWVSEGNIADFEPGLWVGPPAEPPRRVFEAPVSVVGWSPDGHALFFASDGLYVALAPGFTPMRISEALDPIDGMAWVHP
jgi:dipeptidyl aminopeptidase/acylaminoacyl peptidase